MKKLMKIYSNNSKKFKKKIKNNNFNKKPLN